MSLGKEKWPCQARGRQPQGQSQFLNRILFMGLGIFKVTGLWNDEG